MDAIESGIVKLPRIPVADNLPSGEEPVYRELWKHVGKDLARTKHPLDLPPKVQTALYALYSNYVEHYDRWEREKVGVPPVFIVVCQNTDISKLVHDWIAGFERATDDTETVDETRAFHRGALELFRNYDEHGQRFATPRTIIVDSVQLESGDALDKDFRAAAAIASVAQSQAKAIEGERVKARERAPASGAAQENGRPVLESRVP